MEIKLINDIKSEAFTKATELGDKNSKTLGFLPYEAFKKYASENKLIGVFQTSSTELMGYLLYRTSYNKVTIVHCCVNQNHRKKNVALKLVDYLKQNTKQYDGIKLSCRNDYGIDRVWENFNFVPVKEKIGRSKKKLPLTIWWYPHDHNNLFSQISDYEASNKTIAVIDMNIFLDIKHEREEESLALNSNWILSETILFYTREIFIEINRSPSERETSLQLLNHYDQLPYTHTNEEEFKKIIKELKNLISLKNLNDKSDLNHLAYSIIGGANYFITRDSDLLNKKEILFSNYGLNICKPSNFITRLDENIQTSKYKPQRLIGTSINSNSVSSSNIELYTNTFLYPSEKKFLFEKVIRNSLAYPDKFEILTIKNKDKNLALIIIDRSSKLEIKVPVFRFLKNNLKVTLSKHLIYKLTLIANNEKKASVKITEQYLDDEIVQNLKEARFINLNKCWKKINIKGIIESKDIISELSKKSIKNYNTQIILNEISLKNKKRNLENKFFKNYNLERHLSPIKIKDLEIPTYIIAIKPQWAEKLFDDNSQEKLPLFETEYEILLNRENVYYRSAKNKKLNSPARILWYISENKITKCKGKIRATSYIDEVFIDHPKKLFKQFKDLGIYKWQQIEETANESKELMAFVFSGTELFKHSVSLEKTKNIIKTMEKKNFMVLSPLKIKTETYLALYKLGMEL